MVISPICLTPLDKDANGMTFVPKKKLRAVILISDQLFLMTSV
jgi:hypothetical protein